MWHLAWFSWTGADNPSGVAYGLWSGFLSVVLPGLPPTGVLYWKHRCHTPWCWRIGKFSVHEGEMVWQRCRKHHPHDTPGAQVSETPPVVTLARNGQEEART